ncbi:hypothetical protein TSMEX_003399 [Taenia solium]|eukprot:TsM_000197200 transcript=TsM_000197200 gene=TsM_000197200
MMSALRLILPYPSLPSPISLRLNLANIQSPNLLSCPPCSMSSRLRITSLTPPLSQ